MQKEISNNFFLFWAKFESIGRHEIPIISSSNIFLIATHTLESFYFQIDPVMSEAIKVP